MHGRQRKALALSPALCFMLKQFLPIGCVLNSFDYTDIGPVAAIGFVLQYYPVPMPSIPLDRPMEQ